MTPRTWRALRNPGLVAVLALIALPFIQHPLVTAMAAFALAWASLMVGAILAVAAIQENADE